MSPSWLQPTEGSGGVGSWLHSGVWGSRPGQASWKSGSLPMSRSGHQPEDGRVPGKACSAAVAGALRWRVWGGR